MTEWPLTLTIVVFIAAAAAIGYAGTRLAYIADELADRTGMGEVIAGALFVGASTSLPGIITSVATAAQGYSGLAIGNAVGGLTAQTAFLAVADLSYRRANLEHAAASITGLAQTALLITMLAIPLLAMSAPEMTIGHVHPASILLFVIYGFGLRMLARIRDEPMWSPRQTDLTPNTDMPGQTDKKGRPTPHLWKRFAVHAGTTAIAGYSIGEASIGIVAQTGLSETAVGTIFAAISNSLPELVTAVAAVRIGAIHLAVGNVIGGNAFEVLFLAAADMVYTDGSLYHEFTNQNVFATAMVILMVGVLLLGMLRRERHGVANMGWESTIVLGLYALTVVLMF